MLIAVIGFALAAFVLGDFLGYGPMRSQRFDVGKVERTSISFQEFERRVSEQAENWRMETGQQSLGSVEMFHLRQQTWNQMVREILMERELDRVGLQVSAEELFDMIHGRDPHQLIVRSFTNPADGSFDPQQVTQFLRNFDMLEPSVRQQWLAIENYMKQERTETKYQNLISQAYHMPAPLARMAYEDQHTYADVRYVLQPYHAIADSLVNVSDRGLRRVYDQHRDRFYQEASRSLEYVTFNVFATDADRDALRAELDELREEFEQTPHVSGFVNAESDRRFDPTFYGPGMLSPEIDALMFDVPVGTVHGPYLDGNAFVLARLTDVQFRPDSMRASHILIAYAGSMAATPQTTLSYARAEEKADSLLEVVRRQPTRFAELARERSNDPSAATNDGDLGWFMDGDMVPAFNEAVVEAPSGSFLRIESDFGFHVVHVTGKSPATKKVQVAKLTRDIVPSSRTYQNVYARASEFASLLRQKKDFRAVAREKEMAPRVAEQVRAMDIALPGLDNPRPIIQWAFSEDVKEGSYSRIFELDDRFIIASVSDIREEGVPPLAQVRNQVMTLALQEKKYELAARQIREAGGRLEDAADLFDREIEEAQGVRFDMHGLPATGAEPRVIATAFTLEAQRPSAPIRGNAGVFVLEVSAFHHAEEPDDLGPLQTQMRTRFRNRTEVDPFEAIKNNARIEDNRKLFF